MAVPVAHWQARQAQAAQVDVVWAEKQELHQHLQATASWAKSLEEQVLAMRPQIDQLDALWHDKEQWRLRAVEAETRLAALEAAQSSTHQES
jgi:hypothetical protein